MMHNLTRIVLVTLALGCMASQSSGQSTPKVQAPGLQLSTIASEPQIVTPVSCAFDTNGDLYVIESNTHFRPENYSGPKFDRVYRYRSEQLKLTSPMAEVFIDNTTHTMQVCAGPDDWIYVSTRKEVRRYRSHGTIPKTEGELVLKLVTKGDYPHNGLSGMVMGPDGKLYVGMGENLGEPYELVNGFDQKILGNAEGGNIFRCEPDGKNVQRIATGFWNPFGLTFDERGRLWAVDNDPDASPPCRLLQVVPGGDYGFQFQFGRAGTNPLIAWNGQLPGTLGYAAGTGESPCAVVIHRGFLWVTSWGDNRIERYTLHTKAGEDSAMILANPEVVVQGGPSFRPVGMALAPNGDLIFTDWVDRSYTLHGLGKIWRLSMEESVQSPHEIPARTKAEQSAFYGSRGDSLWSHPMTILPKDNQAQAMESARRSTDAFVQTAVMWGESQTIRSLDIDDWKKLPDGMRLTRAMAYRWQDLNQFARFDSKQRNAFWETGLKDKSSEVRKFILRWIAEVKATETVQSIDAYLAQQTVPQAEYRLAMATLEYLERGPAERAEVGGHRRAVSRALDTQLSLEARTTALAMLGPNEPGLSTASLITLTEETGDLARQATRLLVLRNDESSSPQLLKIALDNKRNPQQRADAVMGLASNAARYQSTLEQLSHDDSQPVKVEADRVLARLRNKQFNQDRPVESDSAGWLARIEKHIGDPDAGWRVFFRAGAGQCSACHMYQGRGAKVGPDLSTLAGAASDRSRILDSILQPSREIGPLYVPWIVSTVDGQIVNGIKLHIPGPGGKTRYINQKGEPIDIDLKEIAEQKMADQSIMPTGLALAMDDQELADLIALLENGSAR